MDYKQVNVKEKTIIEKIIHIYRLFWTIVFIKIFKYDIVSKNFIHKLLDFTLFDKVDRFFFPKYVTYYCIINTNIVKHILSSHRNTYPLSGSKSLTALENLAKNTLGIHDCTSIFTCNEEKTIMYHKLIIDRMANTIYLSNIIDDELKKFDENNYERIESKVLINELVCNIFTRLFFGKTYERFGETSVKFNKYIYDVATGFEKRPITDVYPDISKHYKSTIEDICENSEMSSEYYNNLNDNEKKIFVFIMLFAGQETTSAFIEYALFHAIKDQVDIHNKNIINYVKYCFTNFKPARGVARCVTTHCNIDFLGSIILYPGDILGLILTDTLKFGYGKHKCPGRHLAINEITKIITHLFTKYDMEFENKNEELLIKKSITNIIENSYVIKLNKKH